MDKELIEITKKVLKLNNLTLPSSKKVDTFLEQLLTAICTYIKFNKKEVDYRDYRLTYCEGFDIMKISSKDKTVLLEDTYNRIYGTTKSSKKLMKIAQKQFIDTLFNESNEEQEKVQQRINKINKKGTT